MATSDDYKEKRLFKHLSGYVTTTYRKVASVNDMFVRVVFL